MLVDRGLVRNRREAEAFIREGLVSAGGVRKDKPGCKVDPDISLKVKAPFHPYVSRGGVKLERALKVFRIFVERKIALDIGASTGGFTDCLLRHGASKVYAVDVGYGQLDWKLRKDRRVISMEKLNARYLKKEDFPEIPCIATVDVSFISLDKVLPPLYSILPRGGEVVALVKPQFEAGREKVGKKGVVRDPQVHREVLNRVLEFAQELGFRLGGLTVSPIKGPKGNVEFLTYFIKGEGSEGVKGEEAINRALEEARKLSG